MKKWEREKRNEKKRINQFRKEGENRISERVRVKKDIEEVDKKKSDRFRWIVVVEDEDL